MQNVKVVAHYDKSIENYHPTLQFPSALLSVLVSFSLLFGLEAHRFIVLVHLHHSEKLSFQCQPQSEYWT